MRVVGIIQARISSKRHPGKMLRPLYGRAMIDWVVDAARRAEASGALSAVAVATSVEPEDDALAARAAALGLDVHRGALEDVAERMLAAATALNADALVRINGDSPLLDSSLIVYAVSLFRTASYDLATNVAILAARIFKFVSVTSYSTYLIHWDIMIVLKRLNAIFNSMPMTSLLVFGWLVITFGTAWMLYCAWEKPWLWLRDIASSRFFSSNQQSQPA